MKHYQDTETGKIWAFEEDFELQKSNNRNISETLTENVQERPSESHFWEKSAWIHIDDLSHNYNEPLSSVPIYNPAWVTFIFPVGTYVWPDDQEPLNIPLEQINSNSYNGMLFQEVAIVMALEGTALPALISYDGSLALPMSNDFPDASIAINTINEIEGALFLGGLILNTTNHKSLECGSLSEDGRKIRSNIGSAYNRFRNNDASLSECSALFSPKLIKTSKLKSSLNTGFEVMRRMENLSPNFIVKGHTALVAWDLSDALNNLWISIEQLTSYLWEKHFLPNISSFNEKVTQEYDKNKSSSWKVSIRHKLLTQVNYLSSSDLSVLDQARIKRNDLVHSGIIPKYEVVEKLWFTLLTLLENQSGVSLNELRINTSVNEGEFRKHYPPRFSDKKGVERAIFPEWPIEDLS